MSMEFNVNSSDELKTLFTLNQSIITWYVSLVENTSAKAPSFEFSLNIALSNVERCTTSNKWSTNLQIGPFQKSQAIKRV